jgi:thermitase
MNYLHSKLAGRLPWYASWHTNSHTTLFHFALLTFVVASSVLILKDPLMQYSHEQQLAAAAVGLETSQRHASGRILVRFRSGVTDADAETVAHGQGGHIISGIPQIRFHIVSVPSGAEEKVRLALSHNPKVQIAELDYAVSADLVPNDPYYSSQWYSKVIGMPAGWDSTTGSPSVIVAVLDSGIGPSPDISENLIPGYDAITGTANVTADAACLHGPAVAGTVATVGNNGIGPAGIAWHVKVMPITVADGSCYAYWSDVAEGIVYAADHGAKVINVSYGGPTASATLQSAIDYAWSKGAVFFASAGNNNTDVVLYPAGAANAISVAATQAASTASGDIKAGYSSFGSSVDISAPGSNIVTIYGASFAGWSGTSFSSPLAAGLAALVWSVNPALSNAQVVDLMLKNSDDLGATGWDPYYGAGRINVAKTLAAAKIAVPLIADTQKPTTAITSPIANATVSGEVAIRVTAADNMAVTKVELYKDGAILGTSTTAPYDFYWDAGHDALAAHSFQTKAYDAAGNMGASALVSFKSVLPLQAGSTTDSTAPKISIASPVNGTKVKGNGSLNVNVSASDASGVASIAISADGKLLATCATAALTMTCSTTWPSKAIAVGMHTITVVATDVAMAKNTATATVSVSK